MQNISIKTKLILNLIFSVSIIIIIGLVTYTNLQKLDTYQNELNQKYNRAQLAIEVSSSGEKLYSIIANSYIYGNLETQKKEFDTEKITTSDNMEILKQGASPEQQEKLRFANSEYLKIVASYESAILPKLHFLSDNPEDTLASALITQYMYELKSYMGAFKSSLNLIAHDIVAEAEVEKVKFDETRQSIVTLNMILIIAGILLIFISAFSIMRSIIVPLNKAVGFVNNISKNTAKTT